MIHYDVLVQEKCLESSGIRKTEKYGYFECRTQEEVEEIKNYLLNESQFDFKSKHSAILRTFENRELMKSSYLIK